MLDVLKIQVYNDDKIIIVDFKIDSSIRPNSELDSFKKAMSKVLPNYTIVCYSNREVGIGALNPNVCGNIKSDVNSLKHWFETVGEAELKPKFWS